MPRVRPFVTRSGSKYIIYRPTPGRRRAQLAGAGLYGNGLAGWFDDGVNWVKDNARDAWNFVFEPDPIIVPPDPPVIIDPRKSTLPLADQAVIRERAEGLVVLGDQALADGAWKPAGFFGTQLRDLHDTLSSTQRMGFWRAEWVKKMRAYEAAAFRAEAGDLDVLPVTPATTQAIDDAVNQGELDFVEDADDQADDQAGGGGMLILALLAAFVMASR